MLSCGKLYWSKGELRRLAKQLVQVGPDNREYQQALDDLLAGLPFEGMLADMALCGTYEVAAVAGALAEARKLAVGPDAGPYVRGLALLCQAIGAGGGQ